MSLEKSHMKVLAFLLLLSSSAMAQASKPDAVNIYGYNGGLEMRLTFAYDSAGYPETVIEEESGSPRTVIYSDFVHSPGWTNNPHLLYPEYSAQRKVTLDSHLDSVEIDTTYVHEQILNVHGVKSSRFFRFQKGYPTYVSNTQSEHDSNGFLRRSLSWTDTIDGGVFKGPSDTSISEMEIERENGRIMSATWPAWKERQVYEYRDDGSLRTATKYDESFAEARAVWRLDEIRTTSFGFNLETPSWILGDIFAIPFQYVTSASVQVRSDNDTSLGAAQPYTVQFDGSGRIADLRFGDFTRESQYFKDGAVERSVVMTRGSRGYYYSRDRELQGDVVLVQIDSVVDPYIFKDTLVHLYLRYEFEYETAAVTRSEQKAKTINATWDRVAGTLDLSLPKSHRSSIQVFSLLGELIVSREATGDRVSLPAIDLRPGVYLIVVYQSGDKFTCKSMVM